MPVPKAAFRAGDRRERRKRDAGALSSPGAELPQRADGKGLEQVFAQAEDFQHRTLKLLEGGEVELYWVYGMVRNERLNDYVIRPLTTPAPGPGSGQGHHNGRGLDGGGPAPQATWRRPRWPWLRETVPFRWDVRCCSSRCPPRKAGR